MVENKEFLTSKWWILLAEVVSAEQTTQIDGFDVRNEVADFFKHIIYIFLQGRMDPCAPRHENYISEIHKIKETILRGYK